MAGDETPCCGCYRLLIAVPFRSALTCAQFCVGDHIAWYSTWGLPCRSQSAPRPVQNERLGAAQLLPPRSRFSP